MHSMRQETPREALPPAGFLDFRLDVYFFFTAGVAPAG